MQFGPLIKAISYFLYNNTQEDIIINLFNSLINWYLNYENNSKIYITMTQFNIDALIEARINTFGKQMSEKDKYNTKTREFVLKIAKKCINKETVKMLSSQTYVNSVSHI